MKSAAHEVGRLGFKVNAILRGVLEEQGGNGHDDAAKARHSSGRNPPEDVANVAVMLASPALSSLTGCMFPVDGRTMPY